jgi:hypothetical protein
MSGLFFDGGSAAEFRSLLVVDVASVSKAHDDD